MQPLAVPNLIAKTGRSFSKIADPLNDRLQGRASPAYSAALLWQADIAGYPRNGEFWAGCGQAVFGRPAAKADIATLCDGGWNCAEPSQARGIDATL